MTSSITPALKSSARSAYRALFRASGATFSGDDRVLHAFRDKVRTETISGRQEVDPVEYEARVKHAFEVADVLRKNVVQAVKEGEGTDASWKLRMTSDTELGSNETVKAPYSRPARGTPRPKCGEDPNAVSPLPPRSLRHLAGNSTRSYSTAASSSSPNPDEEGPEKESKEEYDRVRVMSVRSRLLEVNRRVSASPTGRDFMTERTLVEDKLGALATRMEFLASEMHDKLYPPSSNLAPAQTLVDLLLDHLPIPPEVTTNLVGPPVQLRQYIRFLQNAAKYTNTVRTEVLSLSPEVRKTIAELVETPSPGTRNPDSVLEKLRAVQWRVLMIKRGIQRIVWSRTVPFSEVSTMAHAVQNAMRNITYARECIEDLDANGPRVEDARSLLEEMEKHAKGSFIMELRKEMERRLEAGIAGKRVEDAITNHGLSPVLAQNIRQVYRRMRQYEEYFPGVLEVVARAQEEDNMEYAKKWRRKIFTRCHKLLNVLREHTEALNLALDQLITMHPEKGEKAALLREAKRALDLYTDVPNESVATLMIKVKYMSWLEWADIVSSRLEVVGELVRRTVTADRLLDRYAWGESGVWEVDAGRRNLFFGARMELVIIYDIAWRLEMRVKQDVEDLREASVLLCEEVRSEFDIQRPASRKTQQPRDIPLPLKRNESKMRGPPRHRSRPMASRRPKEALETETLNSVLILDE